jgi:hypothetical protein
LDLNLLINEKGYYFLAHTIDRVLEDSGSNSEWCDDWKEGTLAEENQKLVHMAAKKQIDCGMAATRGQEEAETRDAVIIVPVHAIKCGLVGVLDPNCKETKKDFY